MTETSTRNKKRGNCYTTSKKMKKTTIIFSVFLCPVVSQNSLVHIKVGKKNLARWMYTGTATENSNAKVGLLKRIIA